MLDFGIALLPQPGYARVFGVLSFETVESLRELGQTLMKQNGVTHFDFSETFPKDSSGLALLTAWLRYAQLQKRSLHFVHLPKQLGEVAELVKISPLIGL